VDILDTVRNRQVPTCNYQQNCRTHDLMVLDYVPYKPIQRAQSCVVDCGWRNAVCPNHCANTFAMQTVSVPFMAAIWITPLLPLHIGFCSTLYRVQQRFTAMVCFNHIVVPGTIYCKAQHAE
jgi:hypothetical protein